MVSIGEAPSQLLLLAGLKDLTYPQMAVSLSLTDICPTIFSC